MARAGSSAEEAMGAGGGWERTLLRLSLNERSSIHSVLAEGVDRPGLSGLDARTHALVSLGPWSLSTPHRPRTNAPWTPLGRPERRPTTSSGC